MCKVTFIYLGLKNVHHRCWGLGQLQFLLMQHLCICMSSWCLTASALLKRFLWRFIWEAGEHKDYLGLHFSIRPFGDARAAQCPSPTPALNTVIVTLSSGPFYFVWGGTPRKEPLLIYTSVWRGMCLGCYTEKMRTLTYCKHKIKPKSFSI